MVYCFLYNLYFRIKGLEIMDQLVYGNRRGSVEKLYTKSCAIIKCRNKITSNTLIWVQFERDIIKENRKSRIRNIKRQNFKGSCVCVSVTELGELEIGRVIRRQNGGMATRHFTTRNMLTFKIYRWIPGTKARLGIVIIQRLLTILISFRKMYAQITYIKSAVVRRYR